MKSWLILATVALLVFAWMFRYEVTTGGPGVMVFKLDRWTGALYRLDVEVGWDRYDAPPHEAKPAAK